MKKIALLLSVAFMLCAFSFNALAAEGDVKAFVTISDSNGELALAMEKITVSDIDSDGVITINDALYCAHEQKFEGGAEKGYASSETQYGISINKLWGVDNGGSYGYYLNDASALSLADPIKSGDRISAFLYTDLNTWSDTYCYFDRSTVNVKAGAELELVLNSLGFDAEWNQIVVPVSNATVTVNGEKTEFKTDENGRVKLALNESGRFVISAESESCVLVPPVCIAEVAKTENEQESENSNVVGATGDGTELIWVVILALASFIGITATAASKRRTNEK